jgi:hypothetical protein
MLVEFSLFGIKVVNSVYTTEIGIVNLARWGSEHGMNKYAFHSAKNLGENTEKIPIQITPPFIKIY